MSAGLFDSLPEDVFRVFWNYVDAEGLCAAAQACKLLNARTENEFLWKAQAMKLLQFNTVMVRLSL